MYNFSSHFFLGSVVWRDDCGFTTHENIYVLLEGKGQVPDNVVDVLVLIMCE